MKRRDFIRSTGAFASLTLLPSAAWANVKNSKLRVAYIGVGGKGLSNLSSTAAHPMVDVTALCDVDTMRMSKAVELYPGAKIFSDYRRLLDKLGKDLDAVVVSTPDHTHAPASLLAMDMGLHAFCEKPLTHHVTEARAMRRLAAERKVANQMGIQCHSSTEYRTAVSLIQSGIIGKVSCVRAWSNKNWGYDGGAPEGSDSIPKNLDWNLWLGTSPDRPYKKGFYHPGNWRKLLDYGCGTLGDMGVHIFDTPYTALNLDVPRTVKTSCRQPTGVGHPEENVVTYTFPGTAYTTRKLKWVWYDGVNAPAAHKDLELPEGDKLPEQGAMFMGEKGRMLLPHWELPKLIVEGNYEKIDSEPLPGADHYLQFVDACMDRDECTAPFSYASRLTEAILLGVVANRFPDKTLHWDSKAARFKKKAPNLLLDSDYRVF